MAAARGFFRGAAKAAAREAAAAAAAAEKRSPPPPLPGRAGDRPSLLLSFLLPSHRWKMERF